MPPKNQDLHGNAPDHSPVALLLVDMINDLEFPGAEGMLERAVAAAERTAALRRRAKEAGIPVVYANDNFGRWRSDFRDVTEHVLRGGVRGEPLARILRPDPDDYFVLKPKHSAFFATTLETLLKYLGVRRLVLTGISGDVCVLFTASDAYMRDFHLHVPEDCMASVSEEENRRALAYMRRVFGADTTPSTELDMEALRRRGAEGEE
ncbi:MAG TPA: isochorismatase family cysteine hydrolase [Longimicrobiaceae bacterium]|nr:isochorismatase family cysteine hydrolase [Longimicrobiaceae bacterium]